MARKKILIFASGDAEGGGSGFQELVENSRSGVLQADIVAVVSNHEYGGVQKRAQKLGIPFVFMAKPYSAAVYQEIIDRFSPDLICLSGWLKLFPKGCIGKIPIINIHPGRLPRFGGKGMHGHHVHEASMAAFQVQEIKFSAVTMHFVNADYDRGTIFFEYLVLIRDNDTPETLAARVNKIEHGWQSYITNLVAHGSIRMEGNILIAPVDYPFLPHPLPKGH